MANYSQSNPFSLTQDIIGQKDFGSPFATYARAHYPRNLKEVFNWAEYLWLHQGVYSKAIQRAVRYFITKVEITGTSDFNIKKKYAEFLTDNLHILDVMSLMGDDLMAYGNSFTSVYRPFNRNLICKNCKTMHPIEQVKYEWADFGFEGPCPKCNKKGKFLVKDIPNEQDDLRITRWNPRSIELEYHDISGETRYYYEPQSKVRGYITSGNKMYLEHTPWEILDAIAKDEKFMFKKGEIYHIKCEAAASLTTKMNGWGLPPFLSNFEQVIHLQMLTKYNEAIAMDMIVPFRFISPGTRKGSGPGNDPLLTIDSGRFMRSVEGMIKQHRKDPTAIHSIPYPVEYQALGGEAKNLAPTELLQLALDELLNSMGIPQEFYSGNLVQGGPPIGLRMFERTWIHFISQMNNWLDWMMGQCSKHLMWEDLGAELTRTSVLEDDLVRQTKLNLLGANKVSNQTALSAFNIDYEYEVDKILLEQQMFDEKAADLARSTGKDQEGQAMMDQPAPAPGGMGGMPPPGMPMDMASMGGPAPGGMSMPMPGESQMGGAMPMGAGPTPMGGPQSLDEMAIQAEQIAQQILTMDPTTRRSELVNLKHSDDALHAMVTSKLKELEQQAAQTGVNLTRQGQIPPGGV